MKRAYESLPVTAAVGWSVPLPQGASLADLPLSHSLVLLLSALVLVMAWVAIVSHRRHAREQQQHLDELRKRDQTLRLALWASNEHYWQFDIHKNEMERVWVELAPDQSLSMHAGRLINPHIHPDDLPDVRKRLRAYVHGETDMLLSEHRVREEGGPWTWVRARGRCVEFDENGRMRLIAGTARNVNAIHEMTSERAVSTLAMGSIDEAVGILDAEFRFIDVNPGFTRMTGFTRDEVIGKDAGLLNGSQHDGSFYRTCREAVRTNDRWRGEMWQQRKDGSDFLCALQCNSLDEPGTQLRLHVMVATDITERRRIEHELRYLANYDTLTNLPNRSLLAERISHAIVRAKRRDTPLALLFMDLDNFKDINDVMGHATGDRVLRAAARCMETAIGANGTLARVSGDEFAAILEEVADATDAEHCAQRILEAFAAPLRLDDHTEVMISVSVGISLFPDHAAVPADLLKHADTAMYHAKRAGKRAYATYQTGMDGDTLRRANLAAALSRAIQNNELSLVYQPQLNLKNNRVGAVEALLRWHSPEHGEVPPDIFIPIAEESGAIIQIGEWVLEEACRTLAAWRAHHIDPELCMSVNLSAVQLLRSGHTALVNRIESILEEHALPPSVLEFELTESVLMANAALAGEQLQAFRDLGISIAVDDFGTGYSSLSYLHRLPINTLKIDKAFIDGLATPGDNEDTAITATIIAMARTLGLLVVAEGVETADQLAALRQHGCDVVQGYWISRPIPADDCLQFILRAQPQAAIAVSS